MKHYSQVKQRLPDRRGGAPVPFPFHLEFEL